MMGKGKVKIIAACIETYVANRVQFRVYEGSVGAVVSYLYDLKRVPKCSEGLKTVFCIKYINPSLYQTYSWYRVRDLQNPFQ